MSIISTERVLRSEQQDGNRQKQPQKSKDLQNKRQFHSSGKVGKLKLQFIQIPKIYWQ